ncbi:4'-phosphopantetheinyl transferase family protein [Roseateles sp.]|uniref:4'-phosphopantetheinyl transferase family protein n=1 Tax=Roseateles sp. TaxID=1971397 RepID=UPI003D0B034A
MSTTRMLVAGTRLHLALAGRLPLDAPGLLASTRAFPLGPDRVQVVTDLRRLEDLFDGQCLDDLPGLPSRASRRRQIEFIGGRLAAERALARAGANPEAPVARGSRGQPEWPAGWTGSISHTASHAYAVATRASGPAGIGIDAEVVVDSRTRADILSICAVAEELPRLERLGRENEAATLLFSAKEAYYKCVFPLARDFVEFDEVVLAELDPATGRVAVEPTPRTRFDGVLPRARGAFRIQAGILFVGLVADPSTGGAEYA